MVEKHKIGGVYALKGVSGDLKVVIGSDERTKLNKMQ